MWTRSPALACHLHRPEDTATTHVPTVGTVTEHDYLRLMYARIGVPHRPICGREITQQSIDEMVDEVMKLPERTRFQVLAPVVRARKGTQAKELTLPAAPGFVRVCALDGNMYDLERGDQPREKNIKAYRGDVVIAWSSATVRVAVWQIPLRLPWPRQTACRYRCHRRRADDTNSQSYACPEHGISVEELTPRMFSFNNPFGAREKCTGLGTFGEGRPCPRHPGQAQSIRESAIKASGWYYAEGSISEMTYKALGKRLRLYAGYSHHISAKEALSCPTVRRNGGERIEMQRESMFGSGTYYNQPGRPGPQPGAPLP